MTLIEARVRAARLSSRQEPFNELYPVRYVESQQMNYHDDGEPGLGPVIASLSLGVTATMSFRLKARYALGGQNDVTKGVEERIPHSNSQKHSSQLKLECDRSDNGRAMTRTEEHTTIEVETAAQEALLQARCATKGLEEGLAQTTDGALHRKAARLPQVPQHKRVLLSIPLKHGSVCIQEGHRLQKFVE